MYENLLFIFSCESPFFDEKEWIAPWLFCSFTLFKRAKHSRRSFKKSKKSDFFFFVKQSSDSHKKTIVLPTLYFRETQCCSLFRSHLHRRISGVVPNWIVPNWIVQVHQVQLASVVIVPLVRLTPSWFRIHTSYQTSNFISFQIFVCKCKSIWIKVILYAFVFYKLSCYKFIFIRLIFKHMYIVLTVHVKKIINKSYFNVVIGVWGKFRCECAWVVDDLCRFVYLGFLRYLSVRSISKKVKIMKCKYQLVSILHCKSACYILHVHMDSNLIFPPRQQRRHISLGIYMCILIFVLLCVTQCGFCSTVPCSKLPDPPPPQM